MQSPAETSGIFSLSITDCKLLHRACRNERRNVQFVQAAFTIRIFVEVGERKACTKLSADLFAYCMRKLPARVRFFKLFAVRFVNERIKRKRVDNLFFFLIDNIVYADIKSAQQNAVFFLILHCFLLRFNNAPE